MKRLLLIHSSIIFAIFSLSNTVFAQEWTVEKGEDQYFNIFEDINGNSFVCWEDSEGASVLIISEHIKFDVYDDHTVAVHIYLYRGDSVEKLRLHFYSSDDPYAAALGDDDISKKIINHLKTKGMVRIISPNENGSGFEITVMRNPNLKLG